MAALRVARRGRRARHHHCLLILRRNCDCRRPPPHPPPSPPPFTLHPPSVPSFIYPPPPPPPPHTHTHTLPHHHTTTPHACHPLQAALDAESARRHALECQLQSLVAEVGEAAGLEAAEAQLDAPPAAGVPSPAAAPAASADASAVADAGVVAPSVAAAAATAAQLDTLLARLRTHAAAQSARDEEQRFALDLAHKEKGVLESRAMLGRRHRAPSATGGGGATAGSGGGASPAVGSGGGTAATPGAAPAGKVDSVLDKENAGGVCTY